MNKSKERSYSRNIMIHKTIRTIICIILCIVSLFPFFLMLINATRESGSIQAGISFIPSTFFKQNFDSLLTKASGLGTPLIQALFNSAIIAVPATILCVYFSTMTAYGLHAYRFKFNRLAWSFILGIMMIPTQVSIIGFYKMMIAVKLNDSYLPLILPAIAAPSTVFFMRQYMKTALPISIVEASRIDGSSELHTFNRIVAPLMKPAIATQAIFGFIASWNNLFTPSIILSSASKYTLPMFIQLLRSEQFRADYGVIYMGLFLTILPILAVYLFLSKYIIAGVALGGVKE